ncbi:MAG: GGDEF domain-containing protein [Clostridiales bacterium]|nr:GGDEF domain-containing protein [Clostridiales bacterium]
MELNYAFYYIEANVVCILIFAVMLGRSWRGVDRQERQRVFDTIMICHVIYFFSDIIWVLLLEKIIPPSILSVSLVNISNSVIICYLSCFWFSYIELIGGAKYIKHLSNRLVIQLPTLFSTLIVSLMFLFFRDKVLGDDMVPTPFYYFLLFFIPSTYVVCASIRAFMRAFQKEHYIRRFNFLVYAIYPIVVAIFGLIQSVWLRAPLFCFGSTILMFYIYILSIENMVSIDPLTKLNNRTQLKRYVDTELSKSNGKDTFFVLMMDLNNFKSINDKYGHMEGDVAVVRTADALRKACAMNELHPFVARYGGDEFIIVVQTEEREAVEELCKYIKKTLKRLNVYAEAPYELTACIGYASFKGGLPDYRNAVAAADAELYKAKAIFKSQTRKS